MRCKTKKKKKDEFKLCEILMNNPISERERAKKKLELKYKRKRLIIRME